MSLTWVYIFNLDQLKETQNVCVVIVNVNVIYVIQKYRFNDDMYKQNIETYIVRQLGYLIKPAYVLLCCLLPLL